MKAKFFFAILLLMAATVPAEDTDTFFADAWWSPVASTAVPLAPNHEAVQLREAVSRVPMLQDIPVLGRLFRRRTQADQQADQAALMRRIEEAERIDEMQMRLRRLSVEKDWRCGRGCPLG